MQLISGVWSSRNLAQLIIVDEDMPTINTISGLGSADTTKVYIVLGYHAPIDGGGGLFWFDITAAKTLHNGGTVIDPARAFPSWTDENAKAAWFAAGTSGAGCWRRDFVGPLSPKCFGAKGDNSADDTKALLKAMRFDLDFGDETDIYKVTAVLQMFSGRKYVGNRAKITTNLQDLVYCGEAVANQNLTDVTVNGLIFETTSTALLDKSLLQFNDIRNIKNVFIENNVFLGSSAYSAAVSFGGYNGANSKIDNLHINKNYIDIGGGGIVVLGRSSSGFAGDVSNIWICENHIKNCGQADPVNPVNAGLGITISGPISRYHLLNNQISNCVYAGIEITIVSGNHVIDADICGNMIDTCSIGITVSITGANTSANRLDKVRVNDNYFIDVEIYDTFRNMNLSEICGNTFVNKTGKVSVSTTPTYFLNISKTKICNNTFFGNYTADFGAAPTFGNIDNCIINNNIFEFPITDCAVRLGHPDVPAYYFKNNTFSNNVLTVGATSPRGIFFTGTGSSFNVGVNNVLNAANTAVNPFHITGTGQTGNDIELFVYNGTKFTNKSSMTRAVSASLSIANQIYIPPVQVFTGAPAADWTLTVPTISKKYTIKNMTNKICTVSTGTGATVAVASLSTQDIIVMDNFDVVAV
jgi:hypothetical protein